MPRTASPKTITRRLAKSCDTLTFGEPVAHVYNPLVYARAPIEQYLERFAKSGVEAMFLGMNPGPFGMAQTGVPFGEVSFVRDWLKIGGKVGRPEDEHPKRPVHGLACTRNEVSGARLWGWAQERFGTPEAFFERFFVWNYCPLLFLEAGGRNLTPDKLSAEDRAPLFEVCDEALAQMVAAIAPERVIGVGKFAEKKAADVLGTDGPTISTILHPSPASPMANRGWAPQAEKQLMAMGIELDS
tara:strand:+ start:7410 stop:8138 length:729 start_codon:yes stop_codon:yes gene_type:complete